MLNWLMIRQWMPSSAFITCARSNAAIETAFALSHRKSGVQSDHATRHSNPSWCLAVNWLWRWGGRGGDGHPLQDVVVCCMWRAIVYLLGLSCCVLFGQGSSAGHLVFEWLDDGQPSRKPPRMRK